LEIFFSSFIIEQEGKKKHRLIADIDITELIVDVSVVSDVDLKVRSHKAGSAFEHTKTTSDIVISLCCFCMTMRRTLPEK